MILRAKRRRMYMEKKKTGFFATIWNLIKRGVKFIWNYIKIAYEYVKDNAWIQPIVIVILIFALVFTLQGAINGFGKIGEWFKKDKEETTINLYTTISMDELREKLDNGEDFVFIISQDTCSACLSYYPVLNQYLKDNDDKVIYALNITADVDLTLKSTDKDEIRERLEELTHRADFEGMTGLSTPTTIIVRNGEFVDAKLGALGNTGGTSYEEFVNFVEGNEIP